MARCLNHILLAWLFTLSTGAQTYTDSLKSFVSLNTTVNLNLLWTTKNHGNIQWQSSVDGKNWNDITAAASQKYKFVIAKDVFLRAKVVSGTCNPEYSKIAIFEVVDMGIDSIFNLTDTSATASYYINKNSDQFVEKGILIDTKENPDLNSKKIIAPVAQTKFSVQFNSLVPGINYYTRPFLKLTDGNYIYGAVTKIVPVKIVWAQRVNPADSAAVIWYQVYCSAAVAESGVFYSASAQFNENWMKINGVKVNEYYAATINGLSEKTQYYVLPYVEVNGKRYYDSIQTFKTATNYKSQQVEPCDAAIRHKIVWNDANTSKKISDNGMFADYGRVKRYRNSDTLLLVYHGGPQNDDWINIYFKRSFDNGLTWENHRVVMAQADHAASYWRFCNPELLVTPNGKILLAYEANTKGDENNSSVQIITSSDAGNTWSEPQIIKTGRSWEPAMVQLPGGEIELFYSCEAKWWPSVNGSYVEQEIHQIYSTDDGQTWSMPKVVAYYPGKRDGMPVPVLLNGNNGVVFAIETVNNGNSPYIIKKALHEDWKLTEFNFDNSPNRWYVGNTGWHGGAPYIVQLPSGETVLTAHRYRGGNWAQSNDMQVLIGDCNAKNFGQTTTPYILPLAEGAVNNSLFVKNDTTIVAISCRRLADGSGGIYWLEGSVLPK